MSDCILCQGRGVHPVYRGEPSQGRDLGACPPCAMSLRAGLAAAWRDWGDEPDSFSLPDEIHELIDRLRRLDAGQRRPHDGPLLAAWDRWQADPDRVLPPGCLHGAFHDWMAEEE